jgi:hypothetical protein
LNFEGFSFFICNSRVFIKCIWFLYMESHSIFVNYQEKNVFFFAFKCYFTVCLLKWHNGLLFVGSLNAVSILFVFQVGWLLKVEAESNFLSNLESRFNF